MSFHQNKIVHLWCKFEGSKLVVGPQNTVPSATTKKFDCVGPKSDVSVSKFSILKKSLSDKFWLLSDHLKCSVCVVKFSKTLTSKMSPPLRWRLPLCNRAKRINS